MEKTKQEIIAYSQEFKMLDFYEMKQNYQDLKAFTEALLIEGRDYGKITGTGKKVLFKDGADKIRALYGLSVRHEMIDKTIEPDKNYISYTYKCTISSRLGNHIISLDRSCSSYETKYRYIWQEANRPDKQTIEQMKRDGSGKFIKKSDGKYIWHIRLENPNIMALENTIMSMAEKRSMVAAIRSAVCASDFIEDSKNEQDEIDISPVVNLAIQHIDSCSTLEEFQRARDFYQKLESSISDYKRAVKQKNQYFRDLRQNEEVSEFSEALKLCNNNADIQDLLIRYEQIAHLEVVQKQIENQKIALQDKKQNNGKNNQKIKRACQEVRGCSEQEQLRQVIKKYNGLTKTSPEYKQSIEQKIREILNQQLKNFKSELLNCHHPQEIEELASKYVALRNNPEFKSNFEQSLKNAFEMSGKYLRK